MADVDFRQILATPLDTIKKPPPMPTGTYAGFINGYEIKESSQKKTPFVRFDIKPTAPLEDVDMDLMEGVELAKRSLRVDFYLTNDAMWRLKNFLDELGVSGPGQSIGETLPETKNREVTFTVKQRPSQDGQDLFAEIDTIHATA